MVLTMTSQDYSRRMGELLKNKLLVDIAKKEYFKRKFNGKLVSLEEAGNDIFKIEINDLGNAVSPTARSELSTIDLLDINRNFLKRLFLQIYYSGMKSQGVFSESRPAEHEVGESEKINEMKYREKHMSFWNEIGLYAPKLWGVEKNVNTETGDFVIGLFTEYWPGATHFLDILAINDRQDTLAQQINDPFVKSNIRNQLLQESMELDEKKSDIPVSVLRTINDFAVRGTNALKDRNLETRTRNFTEYLEKSLGFFNSAYTWHCTVSQDPGAKKGSLTRKFRDAFKILLSRVVNPERFIYSQGDEFLHHYQYTREPKSANGEVVSGVFDADRASLRAIERGRAKALLAPYLDLSYESFVNFIETANRDLEERLKYTVDGVAKERLSYIFEDPVKTMLQHNLWAVVEGVWGIGRAAEDDLFNKKRSLSIENTTVDYSNPLIRFKNPGNMPRVVSLGEYTSRKRIQVLTYRLSERLDNLTDSNGIYKLQESDKELYDGLKNLQEILLRFELPFAFGQRELPFPGKAS